MAAVPTLPFVVLQTHRPYSTADIITAAAAVGATSSQAAVKGHSSSSVSSLKPPPQSMEPGSPTMSLSPSSNRPGSGSGATALSPTASRSSSGSSPNHNIPMPHDSPAGAYIGNAPSSTTTVPVVSPPVSLSSGGTLGSVPSTLLSSTVASTIQTRIVHPQVHYIFENDPLEAEILESVPKSRSITLDFDPRTGVVKNVESFLTHLQVMDVKWVPFQQATLPTLSTSSSSTSLNSVNGMNTSATAGTTTTTSTTTLNEGGQYQRSTAPKLGRTNSSGASSINSSMTTSATRMTRRPSERSLGNQGLGEKESNHQSVKGDEKIQTGALVASGGKDWSLVIDAVEVDDKDLDSESELLEQSMISSVDTDLAPEDYLSHTDALLKSFRARNLLVKKVIDYTNSTGSASSTLK